MVGVYFVLRLLLVTDELTWLIAGCISKTTGRHSASASAGVITLCTHRNATPRSPERLARRVAFVFDFIHAHDDDSEPDPIN